MSLDVLLTPREPLGPIDQANIRSDGDANVILNEHVTPFSEALGKAPILLLGRKGSGKSSILTEFRIRAQHGREQIAETDVLPQRGDPFLITINTWRRFHELTLHVASQYNSATAELDAELVPMEYLASLWRDAFWDDLAKHFYNYCHNREVRQTLRDVEHYVLADGSYEGSALREAEQRLEKARVAIRAFLKERRSDVILLIDSMDRYPIRNQVFSAVLGGLLQGVNALHYDSSRIHVTFCLPEEIEHFLSSVSANIEKDYNAAYRIRWKPVDLLKVVAHRYRLYAKLYEPQLFDKVKGLNFESRDDMHRFFMFVMPNDFRNALGELEDPLAYLIRHTQLLPRHAVAIFNGIITRSRQTTGQASLLSPDCIRDGVADAEATIAKQVLTPYEKIFPGLIQCCEDLLADLTPVCRLSALHKIQARFRDRTEADVTNIWKTLFSMGVLGKVVEGERQSSATMSRYHLALFHYNIDGAFGLSTDALYCFHPIFTRHFGISRRAGDDKRTIYPANVDMVTLA